LDLEIGEMKKTPAPSFLASLVVVGTILVFASAADIARGWTVFSAGGSYARGVRIREPIHSTPVSSDQDPVAFLGSIVLKLAIGLPALLWGGWHLFKPEK
jgi:hypothetical protein